MQVLIKPCGGRADIPNAISTPVKMLLAPRSRVMAAYWFTLSLCANGPMMSSGIVSKAPKVLEPGLFSKNGCHILWNDTFMLAVFAPADITEEVNNHRHFNFIRIIESAP